MNILTAIKEEEIEKEIKKINKINIVNKNIEYKEGILEVLEKNKNINYIIISEILPGEIEFNKLLEKIKVINNKIKIIILSLYEKENKKKFPKNIKILNIKNFKIQYLLKELKIKKEKKSKTIYVLGNRGAGKTVFIYIIIEILIKKNKQKILLIDEDVENNCISNFYFNNKIEKYFAKIKDNLFLLNISQYLKKKNNINNSINSIKSDFNIVIVDTINNNKYFYNNNHYSKYIYLLEANLIEIIKIKKILEKNNNINIILNKFNINSIDKNIIKNIMQKKIIGKINYSNKFNKIINEKNIKILNNKEIKNFKKIINKIIEES